MGQNALEVTFLGGAGTVTGSKFLISTAEGKKILIDCGLFQGIKLLRELNWEPFKEDVYEIDYLLLTHAHLDHTGYIPVLVKKGFKGKILGTTPTLALAEIILRDSAKLQEEEAAEANERGYTRHKPAKPLYETKDVLNSLPMFHSVEVHEWLELDKHIHCRFNPVGHILGACFIELKVHDKILVFSGDIGQTQDPLLFPPERPTKADVIFIESTYGDRLHPDVNTLELLEEIVAETAKNKDILIIPCFAVERAQLMMYLLWQLSKKNHLHGLPVYLDSPMSSKVVAAFSNFNSWHRIPEIDWQQVCHNINFIESFDQSVQLTQQTFPRIVLAGSGMANGGRVLNYLELYLGNKQATILIVGYQAEGTRGRLLLDGAKEVKIKGNYFPVNAEIKYLPGLSAHADQAELLDWLSEIKNKPEKVYIIHGENQPADALRLRIKDRYGWQCEVAQLNTTRKIG